MKYPLSVVLANVVAPWRGETLMTKFYCLGHICIGMYEYYFCYRNFSTSLALILGLAALGAPWTHPELGHFGITRCMCFKVCFVLFPLLHLSIVYTIVVVENACDHSQRCTCPRPVGIGLTNRISQETLTEEEGTVQLTSLFWPV